MNKTYLKSKTLWVSLIVSIAPLFPEVQEILKDDPEIVGVSIGVIFTILRLLTKGKVTMTKEDELE